MCTCARRHRASKCLRSFSKDTEAGARSHQQSPRIERKKKKREKKEGVLEDDPTAQPGQADAARAAFRAPALHLLLRDDHNKLRTDSTVGVLQKRSPPPGACTAIIHGGGGVGGGGVSVLSLVHVLILLSPQISLSLKKNPTKTNKENSCIMDYQLSARCGG